jgi:hypothetical protein
MDPHSFSKLDPDQHSPKKRDPDAETLLETVSESERIRILIKFRICIRIHTLLINKNLCEKL